MGSIQNRTATARPAGRRLVSWPGILLVCGDRRGRSDIFSRSAFERAGQFDPSLRARNAQGCEDLLMCLRITEYYEFRVVPQHLWVPEDDRQHVERCHADVSFG
ncbi:hypothetical protein MES4922_110016 [Mesorhizobium ventifaucium]|uniref:Uncharacterized protein n=1 Tax=Mesorhizobium ventifaucium TaxID=666020 RepID=A0ABM9DDF3_9HYPH|nr:hypothetical protein MES4922_110016 [Mesorhizobium ventifaucium]